MNMAMMNMNNMVGWNFNMNQVMQFMQMINSNPQYLMIWNQILQSMQNQQIIPNNNMNNQFFQNNNQNMPFVQNNMNFQPSNDPSKINIKFTNTVLTKQCIIVAEPNEHMTSIINKYIDKTKDLNSTNLYIFNGKKVVQSLTASELGIVDGSVITVSNIRDVNGAKYN